ncbi:MAG TPA: ABC transporter permease [Pseudidiomarina sp.]|nr:ABC transporter permease [Pseudidiomarina sp.]
MFRLALASLWNRRTTAWLTVLSIAISTILLLGVERVRVQAQENFANTISGTDLIVGARTGSTQLLLSSVFHIGALTNTLSWNSYQHLQNLPGVAWTIPMAMGDSVRGFPVVATNTDWFEHFQYGQQQYLEFAAGSAFAELDSAVVGADVAEALELAVADAMTVSHGSGGMSFSDHDEHPFRIAGILARTGTPVDQAVYIPLAGLGLVHGEYQPNTGNTHDHEHEHQHEADAEPPVYTLSAVLIGLESKPMALRLVRDINTYRGEPLTAIMPGLALQEFWRTLQLFERALFIISVLVVVTGLFGMLTTLLASLRERRREMAVLRSLGAGPFTLFGLLVSEAVLLTTVGVATGVGLLFLVLLIAAPWFQATLGFVVSPSALSTTEWLYLGLILCAAILMSFIPAWRAYRNALADGLTVKI